MVMLESLEIARLLLSELSGASERMGKRLSSLGGSSVLNLGGGQGVEAFGLSC